MIHTTPFTSAPPQASPVDRPSSDLLPAMPSAYACAARQDHSEQHAACVLPSPLAMHAVEEEPDPVGQCVCAVLGKLCFGCSDFCLRMQFCMHYLRTPLWSCLHVHTLSYCSPLLDFMYSTSQFDHTDNPVHLDSSQSLPC